MGVLPYKERVRVGKGGKTRRHSRKNKEGLQDGTLGAREGTESFLRKERFGLENSSRPHRTLGEMREEMRKWEPGLRVPGQREK